MKVYSQRDILQDKQYQCLSEMMYAVPTIQIHTLILKQISASNDSFYHQQRIRLNQIH